MPMQEKRKYASHLPPSYLPIHPRYSISQVQTLDLGVRKVREGGVVADIGEHAHGGEAKGRHLFLPTFLYTLDTLYPKP